MSSDERIRRPKLERTRPIRSWSTLFETPGAAGGPGQPMPGASADGTPAPALGDVVSRSVDLGYRVVDEYIRRGQRAAQRIGERSYDAQAMTSDLQDVAARTLQYASEFAAVWLDLIQHAAAESVARGPQNTEGSRAPAEPDVRAGCPPTPSANEPIPAPTQRSRVQIQVAATQPTAVTLDLHADAIGGRLTVPALRAADPEKPRLTAVGLRPAADGQPPTLWIEVPAGQPAGVYSGVIVDQHSSRPMGTLSVRIGPESPTS